MVMYCLGSGRVLLKQRLVKTGGRLVTHARYDWLLLAERHLTRRLFGSMLGRIAAFPSPAGLGESLIGTKPRDGGGRGRKSV